MSLVTWSAGDVVNAADLNSNFAQLNNKITLSNVAAEAISARDVVFVEDSTLTDLTILQISPSGSFDGVAISGGSGAGVNEQSAQSFTESAALRIVKIQIKLRKQGSPSDNFEVALQADSAGVPSGTDLATASLAAGSISGSLTSYTFTMSSIITTTAATKYWIVMRRSGSRDTSNNFFVAYDNGAANSYANGSSFVRDTSVWSDSSKDLNINLFDQTVEGKVYRASAGSTEYSKAIAGFASASAAIGASVDIIVAGVMSGFSGLSPGKQYYLQDSSGAIGTSAGSNTRKVGISISATQLVITNIW